MLITPDCRSGNRGWIPRGLAKTRSSSSVGRMHGRRPCGREFESRLDRQQKKKLKKDLEN